MNKKLVSTTGLIIVLPVLFLLVMVFVNQFSGVRIDLTEEKLFTLSDGSHNIVKNIDEPIRLYYFFSDKATKPIPQIRSYAKRVEEFLAAYVSASNGKIIFEKIDPEPFSEAEDKAAQFGLQAVPIDDFGTNIYFGLAGTNSVDGEEVIGFFQPDQEVSLEYDISKLIYNLSQPTKKSIGVMSSLPVFGGGYNPMNPRAASKWYFMEQLESAFDIQEVADDATIIADDISTLVVVHPAKLSDETLYALDQFVLRGGKLLAFVDPLSQSVSPVSMPGQNSPPKSSTLDKLFAAWGVEYERTKVLADMTNSLSVRTSQDGRPLRHITMVNFTDGDVNRDDVTTRNLSNIHVRSAGVLSATEGASVTFTPLLISSEDTMLFNSHDVEAAGMTEKLIESFSSEDTAHVIAAGLNGVVSSGFSVSPKSDSAQSNKQHFSESVEPINVILVADTDMLKDDMWVQLRSFLGFNIPTFLAANGNFVINAVDNLTGSNDLISIRGQGLYNRPFEKVNDLQMVAEEQFRAKEQALRQRLVATEQKLQELQQNRTNSASLLLTPEQKQALIQFKEEKLRVRKELRNVQHALNRDIEQLGTQLKIINIGMMPLGIIVIAFFVNLARRRRQYQLIKKG